MITRQTVAFQIRSYLNREITLAALVDWAEDAVFEGDLEESDTELLTDILARLGVADVESFELSWTDITDMFDKLGFRAIVTIEAV